MTERLPASDTPPVEPSGQEFSATQLYKMLLEFGPLVVFFVANSKLGIFWGTGLFMIATVVALAASRILFGKVPTMPLISGAFIVVFGGLTLLLHDEIFIKLKPTIINCMFAAGLLGGLYFGRALLKDLLGEVFRLTDEGWRKLTFRWALFFIALAVLNELVWRSFPTETWISFKLFGIMPLTMLFGVCQIGLLRRYELRTDQ